MSHSCIELVIFHVHVMKCLTKLLNATNLVMGLPPSHRLCISRGKFCSIKIVSPLTSIEYCTYVEGNQ